LDELTAADPFLAIAEALYDHLIELAEINLHGIASEIGLGQEGSQLQEDKLANRLRLLPLEAHRQGFRFVICLDHLDKSDLLDNGHDMQQLEPVAAHASLIIATRERLGRTASGMAASPIVLRLKPIQVPLLSLQAAEQLLDAPTEGEDLRFSEDDKQLLITFVGRHPLLLWYAAEEAYEILAESSRSGSAGLTENDARARIEPVLLPVFDKLWDDYGTNLELYHRLHFDSSLQLDEEARKAKRRATRQQLQRAGLIYEVPGEDRKCNYFSPLFESYVIDRVGDLTVLKPEPPPKPLAPARRMEPGDVLKKLGLQQNSNEANVLFMLLDNAGHVLSKEQLIEDVWDGQASEHGLRTTINRLRDKLDEFEGEIPGKIKTHRGKGYSFEWPDAAP
jgi:hypothetical protein